MAVDLIARAMAKKSSPSNPTSVKVNSVTYAPVSGIVTLPNLEPKIVYPTINPESHYYNGLGQFSDISVGSGGYSAPLYYTTIDSDVVGYKKIQYVPQVAEVEIPIVISNQELLLRSYIYDSPLNTTIIDAGKWSFAFTAKVSNANGITRFRGEVFVRHSDNTETILFSAYSKEINNTVYELLTDETTQQFFNVASTDRLGIKYYASTTSLSNITLTVIIGDGRGGYFETPLATRHSQLRDKNGEESYQHITNTQKNELHTHSNKSALDLVSNTNTGDETNSTIISKIGYTPEDVSKKGVALGYCELDGGGKVPLANLPATILKYIGTWDATTNTPTLTNNDTSKIGSVYNVAVAGTQFGISFGLGDWLIYNSNGQVEKSDNADDVVSVNSKTGIIVLTTADIADSNNKRYVTEAQILDFHTHTNKTVLDGIDSTDITNWDNQYNIERANDGTSFTGASPRDADTFGGLYPSSYIKTTDLARTTIAKTNLFDLGANLTVNRCNAWEYKHGNARYIVVDLILIPTATINVGATLLTFKSSYNPIVDQTFTGTRLTGASPLPLQVNTRNTTRIMEYGGANTQLLTNQTLYINMRIEL